MKKIYGYARISTPKQNIDRQVRNIQSVYSQAYIVREVYTGTKFQGRKELDKLLNKIRAGDTIVFDSVSRMSRNAEEGFLMYEELFRQSVNLIFLKEPHINTDTYKKALQGGIPTTGTNVDYILDGVNKYLLSLAKEQIRLAFEQAEKEVQDLHQRTAEGIETARLAGKQIGQKPGAKLVTKKSLAAKEIIQRHNKSFGGSLNDAETITQAGISRKTFYKYKKELLANSNEKNEQERELGETGITMVKKMASMLSGRMRSAQRIIFLINLLLQETTAKKELIKMRRCQSA